MLQVDNLHAYYGKSHVLHGVSFEVAKGEIVALLGRNGSGRSTTAKAIMGTAKEPKPAPKPLLLTPNNNTAGAAIM